MALPVLLALSVLLSAYCTHFRKRFQSTVTVKRFEMFILIFSISLFIIRVNLLHPQLSWFLYGLLHLYVVFP